MSKIIDENLEQHLLDFFAYLDMNDSIDPHIARAAFELSRSPYSIGQHERRLGKQLNHLQEHISTPAAQKVNTRVAEMCQRAQGIKRLEK